MATKSQAWFDECVVDNKKELLDIGELANHLIHDSLSLGISDPKTTMAIYATIFDAITDVVASKEANYDHYDLNVANRFLIGYDTTDNQEDEKTGNFMVYMQHMEATQSDNSIDDDNDDTISLCVQWNANNIKEQQDVLKDVAGKAKIKMGDIINIKLESHEFILPLFCIIHACIVNYVRLRRREENVSDYNINVAGLYTIGCQVDDESNEEIYYTPSISLKLKFKNDAKATGVKDED